MFLETKNLMNKKRNFYIVWQYSLRLSFKIGIRLLVWLYIVEMDFAFKFWSNHFLTSTFSKCRILYYLIIQFFTNILLQNNYLTSWELYDSPISLIENHQFDSEAATKGVL